jgi:predicted RNase H-like HicB family nuclease
MTLKNDQYTYRVTWSEEDGQYIRLCVEFPSLSWLSATPEAALKGIRTVVAEIVQDMQANAESVPEPIAAKECTLNNCTTSQRAMSSRRRSISVSKGSISTLMAGVARACGDAGHGDVTNSPSIISAMRLSGTFRGKLAFGVRLVRADSRMLWCLVLTRTGILFL